MKLPKVALLVALLASLVGCEPEIDIEPLPCRNRDPGVADLGPGDLATGFLPVEDGDKMFVMFGPQGMHMIVVSVVVDDFERPSVGGAGNEIAIAIRHDGDVVGGTVTHVFPSMKGDTASFLGLRAVFTQAEVDDLADKLADVDVTVRDGCGRAIVATRSIRLSL